MEQNPYQTPESDTLTTQSFKHHDLASRWSRLGAAVLDTLFVGLVYLALFFMVFFNYSEGTINTRWVDDPSVFGNETTDEIIFAVIYIVVFLLMNGVLMARYGQTLGKRLLGIAVVDYRTGSVIPFGRIVGLRFLPATIVSSLPVAGALLSLINVLFIFGEERRCIHDLLANTKVVNT